jgi:hypothetical protein
MYGNKGFIAAFTKGPLPLSSVIWAQSTIPILFLKINFNIILHLRLGLTSGLFLPVFPTKAFYDTLPYPIYGTCPSRIVILDLVTCKMETDCNILCQNYEDSEGMNF